MPFRAASRLLASIGKPVLASAILFAVASCSHVPLMTVAKLSQFDLLKTDPDALRIAVKYPDTIRIPEGGASMALTMIRKKDEEVLLEETIEFEKTESAAEKAELSAELQAGWRLEVYRIPSESVPFFKSFQKTLLKMSRKERNGYNGSLAVGVTGCLTTEEKPSDIRVSTFMKAPELGGYITLLRNFNLEKQMLEQGLEGPARLEPCASDDA